MSDIQTHIESIAKDIKHGDDTEFTCRGGYEYKNVRDWIVCTLESNAQYDRVDDHVCFMVHQISALLDAVAEEVFS